jgi:hypothetical protein
MRLQRDLGEIFEMLGLAEELPVLERPVGGLLTTQGRQRPVASYVFHESSLAFTGLIAVICVRPMAVVQNILYAHGPLNLS